VPVFDFRISEKKTKNYFSISGFVTSGLLTSETCVIHASPYSVKWRAGNARKIEKHIWRRAKIPNEVSTFVSPKIWKFESIRVFLIIDANQYWNSEISNRN